MSEEFKNKINKEIKEELKRLASLMKQESEDDESDEECAKITIPKCLANELETSKFRLADIVDAHSYFTHLYNANILAGSLLECIYFITEEKENHAQVAFNKFKRLCEASLNDLTKGMKITFNK